ncbi:phage virion morphogenesis protein [Pseudomonas aeruginosa]|uniref:phage virion morphogenesis protein n=1 Tax=Pseudomonas aeruginosa TaxID=287 RepID=UPI00215DBC2B|nr:phage virion morphogenesis protein [Pseudomonas aeruginosa]
MVYAAIHQFGGDAGRGHQVEIPARRYLPFDETRPTGGRRSAVHSGDRPNSLEPKSVVATFGQAAHCAYCELGTMCLI